MLQLLFELATPCIDITYAAHTATCTFLLDGEGICRRIVLASKGKRRAATRTAASCVGAQYVASLDSGAAGGLVEMPRVGASMLFARVDDRGRIALVRTGIVTSFESKAAEDPFVDSGTVETSAPALDEPMVSRERAPDPDYHDTSDRTQRIQALRPEDVAAALGITEQGNDLTTAEYRAVDADLELELEIDEEVGAHETVPPPAPVPPLPPTLRRAARLRRSVDVGDPASPGAARLRRSVDDDEEFVPTLVPGPASSASRGMLPRRSDPHQRAAAAALAVHQHAPPAKGSDIQISRRRRGG